MFLREQGAFPFRFGSPDQMTWNEPNVKLEVFKIGYVRAFERFLKLTKSNLT